MKRIGKNTGIKTHICYSAERKLLVVQPNISTSSPILLPILWIYSKSSKDIYEEKLVSLQYPFLLLLLLLDHIQFRAFFKFHITC